MRDQSTYEELQALHVLFRLLGFNLEDWKTDDRPDLQNHTDSWGIEVVQDLYPKEVESTKHLESVWNIPCSEWPSNKSKILSKNKVRLNIYNDTLQSASLGETLSNPEHVIQTIKEKVDLLNKKQYRYFDRYDLYVGVNTSVIDTDHISYVKQIIEEIANYQEKVETKYKMLYLAHPYVLCICNLENKTFEHIAISKELQRIIAESAGRSVN